MASVLRQLSDENLEEVHHMIRRDAMTDQEIAKHAEKWLGKKLGQSPAASKMVIFRYRKSQAFKDWLARYHDRHDKLARDIALQKERYNMLTSLVQGGEEDSFEPVARSIQARLLTLASEASDEELKKAAAGRGWIKNVMDLIQATMHDHYRKKVEELKAQIRTMMEGPKHHGKVDYEAVVAKVDEIMGLS